MEHEILAVAYRLFALDGYDRTTVERIATKSGVSVQEFHRYFDSKEATLESIGFRSVERALLDLPLASSMVEITRRLADGFDASFARDGAEMAFRSIKDHPLVKHHLPLWRHGWATHLAHGLAAAADREQPNFRDRVVSIVAMDVVGIGLDEWLHHSSGTPLADVVSEIVGSLDRALGGSA